MDGEVKITCPYCGKVHKRRYVRVWSNLKCRGCEARAQYAYGVWHWNHPKDVIRGKSDL